MSKRHYLIDGEPPYYIGLSSILFVQILPQLPSHTQKFLIYDKIINTEEIQKSTKFRWYSNQFYLCLCSIAIIVLGLSDWAYMSYQNIVNSLTATVLGIILYSSVVGLQTSKMVKPVSRTLDLVGAPFVVAALLLANLLYFKI